MTWCNWSLFRIHTEKTV